MSAMKGYAMLKIGEVVGLKKMYLIAVLWTLYASRLQSQSAPPMFIQYGRELSATDTT